MKAFIFYDANLAAVQERFPSINDRLASAGTIENGQGIAIKNAAGETGIYFATDHQGRYKDLIGMVRKCFGKGFRNFSVLSDDSYTEGALSGLSHILSSTEGEQVYID